MVTSAFASAIVMNLAHTSSTTRALIQPPPITTFTVGLAGGNSDVDVHLTKAGMKIKFDTMPEFTEPYLPGQKLLEIRAASANEIGGLHHITLSADNNILAIRPGLRVEIEGVPYSINDITIKNSSVPVKAKGGEFSDNRIVDYATGNYAPVAIVGGPHSYNYLQSSAGNTTYWGGAFSLNEYHRRGTIGTQIYHGGGSSTNRFFIGAGINYIDGGQKSSNIYMLMNASSTGSISGVSSSSDTLYTLTGTKPMGYKIFNIDELKKIVV